MSAPRLGTALDTAGAQSTHAVHFYERDDELADKVARFIGDGLLSGEAAIIVATAAHRALFVRRLRDMNIDVEAARVAGSLTLLDAEGTLARFMDGDRPDPELFRRSVGSAIESACTRGTQAVKVRAYGEMVDILWRAGT